MSSRPAATPDSIRFGDDFELDPRAYQLRSGGIPLKLKPIQLNLLFLLVQHRGELVTREQIVEHIWGKDVFLDADNSINGAISKIRQVLRDNAERPRFIETVTGIGYRFIAPTEELSGPLPPAQLIPPPIDIADIPVAQDATASKNPSLRRWQMTALAAAVIVLVAAAGTYFQWSRSRVRQPSGARMMLAVLPFENLTGDAKQEYFSDGMTEEMISRLGNLNPQQLGVIARTSVMQYKNSREGLDQIGRALGVQYVLEGSVRRDGEKVRITAQLIQVRDQTHLWSREYDRELSNLFAVQGEIAQEIADQIQVTLGDADRVAPAQQPLLSSQQYEAYDLYLQGRYFWNKRNGEGFQQAIELFQQAIDKDPQYARAYAGLADAYALTCTYGLVPANENMPKARAAALRALQINEGLAEAHTSLALISEFYDWDWQTAGKEFKRAIQLDPNYATAHQWYAEYLGFQGRFDEALEESERARKLDPLSLIIAADDGVILYNARQYDRAIQQFDTVLKKDPKMGRAQMIVAAYAQKGMYSSALGKLEIWQRIAPGPWNWAWQAFVYGHAGQPAQAQEALKKIEPDSNLWHTDPVPMFVTVYAGMGNKDEAISWLQRAYLEHSEIIVSLKVDPLFDPLRSDPRFQDLLHKVGLDR